MSKIKVFIVDDHATYRRALRIFFEDNANIEIIGEAGDGEEFLSTITGFQADIILMDIRMPVMDGIEATTKALQLFPKLRIIALSLHDERLYIEKMKEAGAFGFLLKKSQRDEIENAIKTVYSGQTYYRA